MSTTRLAMPRDETMTASAIQSRHLHLVRAQVAAGTTFGYVADEALPRRRRSGLALGAVLAIASVGAALAGTLAYAV